MDRNLIGPEHPRFGKLGPGDKTYGALVLLGEDTPKERRFAAQRLLRDNRPPILLKCYRQEGHPTTLVVKTAEDVPLADMPCPCGHEDCWTIKWDLKE